MNSIDAVRVDEHAHVRKALQQDQGATDAPFTLTYRIVLPGNQAERIQFACRPRSMVSAERLHACYDAAEHVHMRKKKKKKKKNGGGTAATCAALCGADGTPHVAIKRMRCADVFDRWRQPLVEADVHTYLTNQVVLRGRSPHVVMCHGARVLPEPRGSAGHVTLFLELADGDMHDWWRGSRTRRTAREWWSALFQILHGLHAVHQLKVQHGDLHDRNVLVRRVDRATAVRYTIPGTTTTTVTIPTYGSLFMLLDFGHASAVRNAALRHGYVRYGQELGAQERTATDAAFHPEQDVVKLFYWLAEDRDSPGGLGRMPRSIMQFLQRVLVGQDPTTGSPVGGRGAAERSRSHGAARGPARRPHSRRMQRLWRSPVGGAMPRDPHGATAPAGKLGSGGWEAAVWSMWERSVRYFDRSLRSSGCGIPSRRTCRACAFVAARLRPRRDATIIGTYPTRAPLQRGLAPASRAVRSAASLGGDGVAAASRAAVARETPDDGR